MMDWIEKIFCLVLKLLLSFFLSFFTTCTCSFLPNFTLTVLSPKLFGLFHLFLFSVCIFFCNLGVCLNCYIMGVFVVKLMCSVNAFIISNSFMVIFSTYFFNISAPFTHPCLTLHWITADFSCLWLNPWHCWPPFITPLSIMSWSFNGNERILILLFWLLFPNKCGWTRGWHCSSFLVCEPLMQHLNQIFICSSSPAVWWQRYLQLKWDEADT